MNIKKHKNVLLYIGLQTCGDAERVNDHARCL